MSIDYKDIGQRIKRLRMEKGLTQERLSEPLPSTNWALTA